MKRKITVTVTILVLAVCVFSISAYATMYPGAIFYRAKENINVRSGPSTDYPSYGLLLTDEYIAFQNSLDLSNPTWEIGAPATNTEIYKHWMQQDNWEVKGYVYTKYLKP